ncbi:hypothetical protein Tco_0120735 [Tanacetum coccineum]
MKKAFQDMLHEIEEVNPTHAYYNDSRISKDTEDPSWSTSFKTRRTQKTSLALEMLWKNLFYFDTSKALDASLVDTKSSGTESGEQDTSSRSGNDAHADDADIRPIYIKANG